MTPAKIWRQMLSLKDDNAAAQELRDLHQQHSPDVVGLIFDGQCGFACQHCIYPPTYGRYNKNLAPRETWVRAIQAVHDDLGVNTFVYAGRSVTREGALAIQRLRAVLPQAKIGLINNGISIIDHLDVLSDAGLDWIDISFDGIPVHHDAQRNRIGSFREALIGVEKIIEARLTPRLAALSCITTINSDRLLEMVHLLTDYGIHDFCFTPMTFVPGARPAPALAVEWSVLERLVLSMNRMASEQDHLYLELGIFDPIYLEGLSQSPLFHLDQLIPLERHFELSTSVRTSSTAFRYTPSSLVGISEVVINADGNVVAGRSMVHEQIPSELIFGNLFTRRPRDIWRERINTPAFQTSLLALEAERHHWRIAQQ